MTPVRWKWRHRQNENSKFKLTRNESTDPENINGITDCKCEKEAYQCDLRAMRTNVGPVVPLSLAMLRMELVNRKPKPGLVVTHGSSWREGAGAACSLLPSLPSPPRHLHWLVRIAEHESISTTIGQSSRCKNLVLPHFVAPDVALRHEHTKPALAPACSSDSIPSAILFHDVARGGPLAAAVSSCGTHSIARIILLGFSNLAASGGVSDIDSPRSTVVYERAQARRAVKNG